MTTPVQKVDKLATPTFMFTCMDGPETAPLRIKHLEGHLIYIENNNEKYRVAGPMRGTGDGEIVGSYFLIEAETEDQARAVMAGDPYMESGMYASVTVYEVVPACGVWMGGVIWDRETLIQTHPK